MIIIGITGTNGSGKGTIVEYLKNKGFAHYSAREFIYEEIDRRNMPRCRDSLIKVANDLASKYGASHIAEELFKRAQKSEKNVIIESLRRPAEIESLKNKGEFYMFAVDASPKLRHERLYNRKKDADKVSFEEFSALELRELSNTDPNKQNLNKCIEMSDYKFMNDSSFEDLYKQVDDVLGKIK